MFDYVSVSDEPKVKDKSSPVSEHKSETSKILAFPTLGIKLRGFRDFIETNGSEDAFIKVASATKFPCLCFSRTVCIEEPMTTKEVCDRFLKPLTFASKSSYCEYLQNRDSKLVGEANVFISHAWKYHFMDVVRSLEHHFKDEAENVFVWFDLFSNNQHQAPNLPFEWWQGIFWKAIGKFGRVVMVLSPWNNPIPFTRAWCLWEIYCAVTTGSKFEVAITPDEYIAFVRGITRNYGKFYQMLADINVEKSEATNAIDKERIFDAVESSVGVAELNKMVIGKMEEWVITAIDESITEENVSQLEVWDRKLAKISLLYNMGNFSDALKISLECLTDFHGVSDDKRQSKTYSSLGNVFDSKGDYDMAAEYYEKSLAIRLKTLGSEHPYVAESYNNLGNVFDSKGDYDTAAEYYEKSLEILLKTLGSEHPDVAGSYNNLGNVFDSKGDYDTAAKYHEMSLAIRLKTLGSEHPLTKSVRKNSYASQKKKNPTSRRGEGGDRGGEGGEREKEGVSGAISTLLSDINVS